MEFGILVVGIIVGNAVRFKSWDLLVHYDSTLLATAVLYACVLLACTAAMGVYSSGYREGIGAMVVRTIVSYCLLGCAALTILYYIAPILFLGRGVLAYSILFSLIAVIPMRWIFFNIVGSEKLRSRALVLGVGERAKFLEQRLAGSHSGVADIVAFIRTTPEEKVAVSSDILELKDSLIDIAKQYDAQEIVVALDGRRESDGSRFPLGELLDCKHHGIEVSEAVTFYEKELGILELSEIRPGWMVFTSGFSNNVNWDVFKRVSDITVSLVILCVAWPLMLIAALAIWLESGRPIFYDQVRVGWNGRPFNIYKFRSMITDAEVEGRAVWAGANDSRITRVGAVLRNTRIDELPQLYNVLRGDMSIVGPRPERPEFVVDFDKDIPFYKERYRVKPGLMGWAQLNYPYGASLEDAAEKLRYDLYYVKNRSLLLDLIIMVQTVQVILLGTGVR